MIAVFVLLLIGLCGDNEGNERWWRWQKGIEKKKTNKRRQQKQQQQQQ